MRERLFEMRTCLANESLDRLVGYLTAQRERVDHHTDGVRHLEVRATVRDRGDTQIIRVRETRERIEHRCECGTCRRHFCFLCQSFGGLDIHRGIYLTDLSVFRIRQVRRNFGRTFHLCQLRMEELLRCGIFGSRLGSLFVRNKLGITAHLLVNRTALEQRAQFIEEHIVRCTVTNEVMYIAVEVERRLRAHDTEPAQQVFAQVERPYKLRTISLQLVFFQLSALDS